MILSNGRIELAPREFDVLLSLARARGGVVSRDDLLREVWELDFEPGTKVVEVQISRLRIKVDTKEPSLIHSVPG